MEIGHGFEKFFHFYFLFSNEAKVFVVESKADSGKVKTLLPAVKDVDEF